VKLIAGLIVLRAALAPTGRQRRFASGRIEPREFGEQRVFRFGMGRILADAIDRTDLYALRFIEVTDAFGAFGWVDDINFVALGDCAIGALGFANVAVDAFVGNHQGHVRGFLVLP
jgi:hypothetical protein